MDPITHACLGAVCAQGLLYNKDRKNAWIAGGLAAMAPDLDVLIQSVQDPLLILIYHRHFTHSLLFIPFGAGIVTLFLMLFQRFRLQWQLTFLACLIGYATHGLLDALTSYGTVLYWPFSDRRISLDIVSIVDPFVTFPLLLGLSWSLIHETRKGLAIGLFIAIAFLLFNAFQHHRAISALVDYAKIQHWNLAHYRTYPMLASSTQWRGLAIRDAHFLLLNIETSLIRSPKIIAVKTYPLSTSDNLPEYIKKSPNLLRDYYVFLWFTDGYLVIANKDPLFLTDGRFLRNMDSSNSLWGILFEPNQPHVKMTGP